MVIEYEKVGRVCWENEDIVHPLGLASVTSPGKGWLPLSRGHDVVEWAMRVLTPEDKSQT